MADDLDAMTSESLKIGTRQLLEVVDNKMPGIRNTLEGVSDSMVCRERTKPPTGYRSQRHRWRAKSFPGYYPRYS